MIEVSKQLTESSKNDSIKKNHSKIALLALYQIQIKRNCHTKQQLPHIFDMHPQLSFLTVAQSAVIISIFHTYSIFTKVIANCYMVSHT